jgi:hypothetical protein
VNGLRISEIGPLCSWPFSTADTTAAGPATNKDKIWAATPEGSFTPSSTIEPSQRALEAPTRHFRISLEPPSGNHFLWDIIQLYVDLEKTYRAMETSTCEKDINEYLQRLNDINKNQKEVFDEKIRQLEAQKPWSQLGTILQYISSITCFMVGVAVVTVSPWAGGFLIAAGAIGFTNRMMSDLRGWEWIVSCFSESQELQKQLAARIDTSLTYISLALTVVGTIGAYHAGALSLLAAGEKYAVFIRSIQIISHCATAMQIVVQFRGKLYEKRIFFLQAAHKENNAIYNILLEKIPSRSESLQKTIELTNKISDVIKQAIAQQTSLTQFH